MIGEKAAFLMGFQDGQRDKKYYSARQVEQRFPDWADENVRIYLNGLDDGVAGDTFRVDQIKTPDLEYQVKEERLREAHIGIRGVIQFIAGYTGNRFDLYCFAGKSRAEHRAHVMARLLGVPRVPQSKAGMHALTDALYKEMGVTGDCLAAQEDDFIAKAKEIFARG